VLLTLTLLASIAVAVPEELPDAPFSTSTIEPVMLAVHAPKPPRKVDGAQWSLLASDASLRLLDAASTLRADRYPWNHENVLPAYLSHHAPAMYGFSAGIVGFNWLVAHELKQHGHSKLARLPYMIDIGVEVPSLRNFALPTTPHVVTMRKVK
jgi:hypothetical protein